MKNFLKLYLVFIVLISFVILFYFFSSSKDISVYSLKHLSSSIIYGEFVYYNDIKVQNFPETVKELPARISSKGKAFIYIENSGILILKNDTECVLNKKRNLEFLKGEIESVEDGIKNLKIKAGDCTFLPDGRFILRQESFRGKSNLTLKSWKGKLICNDKVFNLEIKKEFVLDENGNVRANDLLLPPSLKLPKFLERIGLENGNKVNLLWEKVEGASGYIVEIAYDPSFVEGREYKTYKNSLNINFVDFKNSPVFWRVFSIDKHGNRGFPSRYSKFYLEDLLQVMRLWKNPPKLIIEEPLIPQGNLVIIKGETERGVKVTVNGSEVNIDNTGKFMYVASFDEIGEHEIVIRAVNLSGRKTFIKRKVFIYEK